MPYYRKKPILIEARQYTGDNFLELRSCRTLRLQDHPAQHLRCHR